MAATTVSIPVPKTDRKITVNTGLFINNQFVPSVDSKETIEYVLDSLWFFQICGIAADGLDGRAG